MAGTHIAIFSLIIMKKFSFTEYSYLSLSSYFVEQDLKP